MSEFSATPKRMSICGFITKNLRQNGDKIQSIFIAHCTMKPLLSSMCGNEFLSDLVGGTRLLSVCSAWHLFSSIGLILKNNILFLFSSAPTGISVALFHIFRCKMCLTKVARPIRRGKVFHHTPHRKPLFGRLLQWVDVGGYSPFTHLTYTHVWITFISISSF